MKKILVPISVIAALAAAFGVYVAVTNSKYQIARYTIASDRLPADFEGFRIVQISDLHSRDWPELAADVSSLSPDTILISGDLVNRGDTDFCPALETVEKLAAIAPVYYAPGNHEADNGHYPELRSELISLGVNVLEDASVKIVRGDGEIRIAGIVDPVFSAGKKASDADLRTAADASLSATVDGDDSFTVLISHRPEQMLLYEAHTVDAVFTGHAHGGALELPFVGALWAPGQGMLPAYEAGLYESEYTAMIVSRGLGTSAEPFRVNCPFELVVCTLTQAGAND